MYRLPNLIDRLNPLRIYAVTIGFLIGYMPIAYAAADSLPDTRSGLVLDSTQTFTLLIGAISPLVAYVLNYHAPWVDEKTKMIVQLLASAVAGGLYNALAGGHLGFDVETLQVVGTAVVAAVFSHNLIYKPGGINVALGGGRNAQDTTESHGHRR